jgi:hypothetical protein
MKSAVIVYEDAYHEELHALVKALRRDLGHPGVILEPSTVRGAGGFVTEVPRILRTPLKQTKAPPERVVCLADADEPGGLAPGAAAPPAPGSPQEIETWLTRLETDWQKHLADEGHLDGAAVARLRVVCLRWSKESLLVASPSALVALANGGGEVAKVEAVLGACSPDPRQITDDADFLLRYRKPQRCLDQIVRAVFDRGYKKGRDDEDLLRERVRPDAERRGEVLRRSPDLGRLLDALS